MVNEQVRKGGYGLREICVRINSLETPWGEDDLRLIASSGCHAIALPKVETAEQVPINAIGLLKYRSWKSIRLCVSVELIPRL